MPCNRTRKRDKSCPDPSGFRYLRSTPAQNGAFGTKRGAHFIYSMKAKKSHSDWGPSCPMHLWPEMIKYLAAAGYLANWTPMKRHGWKTVPYEIGDWQSLKSQPFAFPKCGPGWQNVTVGTVQQQGGWGPRQNSPSFWHSPHLLLLLQRFTVSFTSNVPSVPRVYTPEDDVTFYVTTHVLTSACLPVLL